MKNLPRILISVFLAFTVVFMTDTGFASACGCHHQAGIQQHSCCLPQKKPSPCHHQGANNLALRPSVVQADCGCVIKAPDHVTTQTDIKHTIENLDVVSGSIAYTTEIFNPVSLQKPVWLRKIYYPDKSGLYLDRQHLLL